MLSVMQNMQSRTDTVGSTAVVMRIGDGFMSFPYNRQGVRDSKKQIRALLRSGVIRFSVTLAPSGKEVTYDYIARVNTEDIDALRRKLASA